MIAPGLKRVGIDPTGAKFRQYYPDDITLVPDFFSAEAFLRSRSTTGPYRHFDCDVL